MERNPTVMKKLKTKLNQKWCEKENWLNDWTVIWSFFVYIFFLLLFYFIKHPSLFYQHLFHHLKSWWRFIDFFRNNSSLLDYFVFQFSPYIYFLHIYIYMYVCIWGISTATTINVLSITINLRSKLPSLQYKIKFLESCSHSTSFLVISLSASRW